MKKTCSSLTLNSSLISETKLAICFISRSTEDSAPVFSRVVIANVAIDLFESVIKFSKSKLQAVTAVGWLMATWFSVLTAANRSAGFGKPQNTCRTLMAGASSLLVVLLRLTMACAASYTTISDLWRRQDSMNSKWGESLPPLMSSSSRSLDAMRICKAVRWLQPKEDLGKLTSMQTAYGDRRDIFVSLVTSLVTARRSDFRMW